LLAALGEVVLRGVADAIVAVPVDLALEVADLLSELL
jgi:hypothetical protein